MKIFSFKYYDLHLCSLDKGVKIFDLLLDEGREGLTNLYSQQYKQIKTPILVFGVKTVQDFF